ncbi:sodium- and chloride-dependent glycine transporter 1-like [Asterias rubens]|uniref:sodium- and chloride-dependent glycine transporter 1-like n=1 Tax=Asterias rubens TaxID=7604 RepID=UPI0014558473|nr:sodium- and chloride-dependent glycine transporter 1-like [Asterias rubens]XP_033631858.1 sodium- and chloride-dependent glycine transporter 1-like [Asterias rubens]
MAGKREDFETPMGPEEGKVMIRNDSSLQTSKVVEGDENETRGNWSGKLDFVLSCVSFAVGLGNIWRFPFLCFENGGGAFLIPYLIMILVAGLPMFFMELSFGQFASQGCLTIWKICPLFKGLGYGMLIVCALVTLYYNVIIAYAFFYLFASFTSELPWKTCGNEWNTGNCTIQKKGENGTLEYIFQNGTSQNETLYSETSQNESFTNITHPVRPSEEYFNNYVLTMSDGMHIMGPVKWELALCLLLAWIAVFFSLIKGIKTSGKVVYVTSTLPYVVLLALFIRGVTLEGAIDGIIYYIKPDLEKLARAKVWQDAAVQIFYSLGTAFGSLHTLSSYNKFHNNVYRDAIIVTFINCGTSVFAGFVIFSVIGFMAADAGVDIEKVVASGPGLAFIAYPEAIARMPFSTIWALLFFAMILMLGIGSEFCMFETVITGIVDELEKYNPIFRKKKYLVTLAMSVLLFLLGLPMVTHGGIYLLTIMNAFSAGLSVLIIAMLECIVVAYIYGADRFLDDINVMVGFRPGFYWKACWKLLSPAFISFIIIFTFVGYQPMTYNKTYVYPVWAEILGWLMSMSALAPVMIYPIYYLYNHVEGTFMERLRQSLCPTNEWGPALERHRKEAGFPILPETDHGITLEEIKKLHTEAETNVNV